MTQETTGTSKNPTESSRPKPSFWWSLLGAIIVYATIYGVYRLVIFTDKILGF